MRQKKTNIPVISLPTQYGPFIAVSRKLFSGLPKLEEVARPHRDDWHLFILQENGITTMEIDFKRHIIKPGALVYIHPSQVHRLIAFEDATIITLQIDHQNLKPEYLNLLEDINPANELVLAADAFSIISEMASFCIKFSERKQEKLYNVLLKDSCNTLAGLIISQFLAQSKPPDKLSRSETITKSFKALLNTQFSSIKSPAAYAGQLHVSTPYLNECVRNATGHSVSYHIQQRIMLEAERLLYHSEKSVKEIAFELGYDDHSYFTRLFTKVTGVSPLVFRTKNFE